MTTAKKVIKIAKLRNRKKAPGVGDEFYYFAKNAPGQRQP